MTNTTETVNIAKRAADNIRILVAAMVEKAKTATRRRRRSDPSLIFFLSTISLNTYWTQQSLPNDTIGNFKQRYYISSSIINVTVTIIFVFGIKVNYIIISQETTVNFGHLPDTLETKQLPSCQLQLSVITDLLILRNYFSEIGIHNNSLIDKTYCHTISRSRSLSS